MLLGGEPIVYGLCRPPGHHATPVKGMGFCIFNHVAIAAKYAQQRYGVGRVLIVDIRHIRQYAAALRAGGCTSVRRASSDIGTIVLTILTLGAVRPGTLIARKDAQPAAGGTERATDRGSSAIGAPRH